LQPKYYQLLKCIDDKIDQKVTIQEICNRLGLCQRAAERVFREHLKISPKQYQLDQRLTRAANLLHNSALALAEVAEATGFSSASSLSTSFKTKFRISPLKFRKQGAIEPGATMVGKARNRRIETLPEESRSKDTIKITPA
ncbi:MAG: helix-turn-helix domain-containing protein, partial [Proteobacteria bacterium]|nr:helix-turn-helix domain-containing protein [Pseudomonadota bacterium]